MCRQRRNLAEAEGRWRERGEKSPNRSVAGAPVEQARRIQERVHFVNELLHIEHYVRALFGAAGLGTGFGCLHYCCGLIEPLADAFEQIRNQNCWWALGHYGASTTTTHALFASEVERIQSNVLALLVPSGSSSDQVGAISMASLTIDPVTTFRLMDGVLERAPITWRFTAIDNIGHEIA